MEWWKIDWTQGHHSLCDELLPQSHSARKGPLGRKERLTLLTCAVVRCTSNSSVVTTPPRATRIGGGKSLASTCTISHALCVAGVTEPSWKLSSGWIQMTGLSREAAFLPNMTLRSSSRRCFTVSAVSCIALNKSSSDLALASMWLLISTMLLVILPCRLTLSAMYAWQNCSLGTLCKGL